MPALWINGRDGIVVAQANAGLVLGLAAAGILAVYIIDLWQRWAAAKREERERNG